jgi:eukaryotic-like serine/threonine-protein kinase
MSPAVGDRFGPYEILAPLGAGGMGEVHRARDTRLDRIVAIKTTSGPFSERFEREARAISALNHPHICTLYDVGEHDGAGYLVMELVDGTPLAGPIPFERAAAYGVQICSALEAAHRKGIVHRDLKPANILVTKGGVKLLDFGLAKRVAGRAGEAGEAGGAGGIETEAALTNALTGAHTILGTPQYMAPEQIEGKEADARTDIFAFGCVLYELLTGQKAFDGKTPSSVMAAILATEPRPMKELQPLTPSSIERVVRRCLAKDPDDRWQSARDLRAELEWIAKGRAPSEKEVGAGKQLLLPWAVAALFAVATGAVVWAPWRAAAPEAQAVSFEIHPPAGFTFRAAPIMSPDGHRVALSVRDANAKGSLIIRRLDSVAVESLAGTESTGTVQAVGWSPDSRFVLFAADGRLQKIDANGGPAQTITTQQGAPFASWGAGGDVVLTCPEGLQTVSASGGTPRLVTKLDASRQEQQHYAPQFLPDRRHFLYFARSARAENNAIRIGSLDAAPDSTDRILLTSRYNALYARGSDGVDYLLSVADGNLMARRFDLNALTLVGEPVPIVPSIGVIGATTLGVSASAHGALAYSTGVGGQLVAKQFQWIDRAGRRLADVGKFDTFGEFTVSADEKRVAVSRRVGDNWGIWFLDLERGGALSGLPGNAAANRSPIWSPDGSRVFYTSDRGDGYRLYETNASGAGPARLASTTRADSVNDVAPDGRSVLYESRFDLWVLDQGKPTPITQTPSRERDGRFSPDGKWIAYTSDESGDPEVYVQSFPTPGAKSLVSIGGGTQPRWSRDGKELFYLAADGRLMSAGVRTGSGFQSSTPVVLFETSLLASNVPGSYAVSRDGQKFLLQVPDPGVGAAPMTVLTDWLSTTRRK